MQSLLTKLIKSTCIASEFVGSDQLMMDFLQEGPESRLKRSFLRVIVCDVLFL